MSKDVTSGLEALVEKHGIEAVEAACVALGINHGAVTYNIETASAISGLSKWTLRDLYRKEEIPTRNYNSTVLLPAYEFKRFLRTLPTERRYR